MSARALLEDLAFSPLLLILLVLATLVARHRCARGLVSAYRVSIAGTVALLAATSLPFVAAVSFPLRCAVPVDPGGRGDAIVAPGGSTTCAGAPNGSSSERAHVAALAFLDGRAPLVLTAGSGVTGSLGTAKAMRIVALGMGVPQDRIVLCTGTNTYREAAAGREALEPHGVRKIVLVTSWLHMTRAAAVWRKQGFDVIPHTLPEDDCVRRDLFAWWHLSEVQSVCHEYVGLLVYWLRGWI